jgi:hypothetical protein
MHFSMKNTLKNNSNHTFKQAITILSKLILTLEKQCVKQIESNYLVLNNEANII